MEKNYLNCNILVSLIGRASKKFRLLLLLLVLMFGNAASSQVTITKPNLSIAACSGFPSAYSALGNIVITESSNSNFSIGSGITLILTAPTNFEFQTATGSVSVASNANLSAATIAVTTSTITITYSCGNTNKADVMTISGIQARATNLASTGNITRTGGTGVINGLANGTTVTNTLTSTTTPVITDQPIATSVCTNGTTTLSVSATGGATYQWRKNGSNIVTGAPYTNFNTATLSITNPTIAENGASFDVIVSSATPTCSITSNAAILTVNPLPVAAGTISGTSTVCQGQTSISYSVPAITNATSYTWAYSGTGATITGTTNNVNISFAANASSGNLTVYGTNFCGNGTISANYPITVNSLSVAPTGILGTTIICSGDSTTLNLNGGTAGTGATAEWFSGSCGGTAAGTGNSIIVSPANTTTYYVRYNGTCNTTTCASVTVTVNPYPVAAGLISGTPTVCQGQTSVSYSTPAITNTSSYIWSYSGTGATITGTTNNISVTFASNATSGNLSVNGTNGCGNGVVSVNFPITVNTLSIAPTNITGTTAICAGESTTLTLNGGTAGTGAIAEWFSGSCGGTEEGTGSSITVSPTTDTTYFVRYNGTCNTTTCASISVNINPLPTATAGGTQTICSNGTATVSGATAGNGTIFWTENGAGSITAGANTLTPTYTPTVADAGNTVTLTMTVTSFIACSPTLTATATYTVIVDPLPTATAGGSKTICSNATATVSGAFATNGTISWTENGAGSITSGANTLTPTYAPTAADAGNTVTLTMTVTSNNTCAPQTATANYSIIVNPLPIAIAGGTQTICSNTSAAVIGAIASNGTISWTENGAGSIVAGGTTKSPTYTAAAADAGNTVTLTMTVTSNNACAPQIATATYSIFVNPLPTATAGGSKTICPNSTATVSGATASNGTILWTENGGGSITAGATTLTPTYTPTASDAGKTITLTMTVTSAIACSPSIKAIATYSVIVSPLPVGSASPQTICNARTTNVALNSTLSGTTYTWTAAILTTPTGGTITGFSDCPGACGNSISQTLTNTGTTAGVVRYIVTPTANSCIGSTFTVDVTVNPKPIITLTNVTAQCSITLTAPTYTDTCGVTVTGTTGDPIFYNLQGSYTVVWSFALGTVISMPQNVIIDDTIAPVPSLSNLPSLSFSGCQIDNIPPPTAIDNCIGIINGTSNIAFPLKNQGLTAITWTYNDGNGNTATQTQNITLTAPPISGGDLKGYASDFYTVADATENIAISSCPNDINPVTINLSNEIGTIIHWEKFEVGDANWTVIANNTNTYDIIFDFNNTKSTLFRVLVQVENCTAYSNMVNVHAIPPDVPPILDQNLFNICLNEQVSLVARSGYNSAINVSNGGDYNTGQFPNKWDPTQWRIDGDVAGTAWTAAANNRNYNNWSGTNNHPVGTLYRIEYDSSDFKFGIAHGNYNSAAYIANFGVGPTTLETPIFSLAGLKTASIDFDQAYNLHAGDIAKLELSLDGGATYTVVLQDLIGTSPQALSWGDSNGAPVPYPYKAPKPNNSTTTYFDFGDDNSSFDVSDYIGNDNVRVKWTFFGTTDESTWAIDNITIPIKPYYDEVEWTDGLGEPGEYIIRDKLEVAYTFAPTAPGVHQYGATSLINGCRAYDPDGTAIATVNVNYSYAGEAQGYTNEECGERTVILNAYDNTKTAKENFDKGAYPSLIPSDPLKDNDFNDDPGTGVSGKWSVFSTTNTCGSYSFSDDTSPNSSFSGDSGVYTLRWRVGTGTAVCDSFVQVTLTSCNVVDFDGVDDYITFKDNYGLGSAFSIEVWVKPEPQPISPPSNIQTIISKRNANNLIDGYDLRLESTNPSKPEERTLTFNWNNGGKITSPFPLTTSRWYHVAVTYDAGIYRLYVDGIEVVNAAGSAPISNSFDCIAGAMDQTGNPPNKPANHYSGWMDELRIWGVGLSSHHIRQMMNQQIIDNGIAVRGEIIPIDINGPDANLDGTDDQPLFWSNLNGYYRMDQIDCGYLKPFGGKGVDGKLRNITSSQEETAPLPYISIRNGDWMDRGIGTTPWKYGDSVWDYPNSTGYNNIPIDWNIVQTSNDINSGNKDITILGLISTSGKLTIANPAGTLDENNSGQGLWITHYLLLNGTIDLVGESQLVEKRYGTYNPSDQLFITNQFSESILDEASTGYIERDQKGKQNSFNYNYWSSPVTIQGSANNAPYSISGVMKDGTNSANPIAITFGDGVSFADGALTSPIKTSNRWIWSYNSQTPDSNTDWQDYFQWNYIKSTGTLKVGEGYTMKGTGGVAAIDETQNYVFVGKPNSGTIALNLPYDQSYVVGNPYPCAMDANEFILDNLEGRAGVNVFNGALYFWDHFGLSNNHNLAEYEGGYATYTLMGGVAGINDSSLTLNDGASGLKIPGRYIPVAQGFFVGAELEETPGSTTTVAGGTLNFKNSQRVFHRETSGNSIFMKSNKTTKTGMAETDTRLKIRLGFDSTVGKHRQILVGADPNTTSLFDIGYDAPMDDTNENDMYWQIGDSQFVIQAVPHFNSDQKIPLGLVVANAGLCTIKIDALENFPSDTKIYLHDSLTGIYHDIRESDFTISLESGEYNNRFSLQFSGKTLDVAESKLSDEIMILYSNNYKYLIIKNNILDVTVNSVFLYNILGQSISNWNVENKQQTIIQIPVKNVSTGVYIVKLKTSKGNISKQIIIQE